MMLEFSRGRLGVHQRLWSESALGASPACGSDLRVERTRAAQCLIRRRHADKCTDVMCFARSLRQRG
ncbi:hypothetical protein NEUTE2DRAFT_123185 [Neurospora tetrasperma FGSC 2509]|nr:hypothetical protein NEUTE2DRAFT_123185 [Neurospora tetrasperma FGSC 2509]